MNCDLKSVIVLGADIPHVTDAILSTDALMFLAALHRKFNGRRLDILKKRHEVQEYIDKNHRFPEVSGTFIGIQKADWKVAPVPKDLEKRWVEITGPVERKQIIGALNCGADVFMADFEDASAPSWSVMMTGQVNIRDAVNKTISFSNPDGKIRKLNDKIATLLIRPRGWHLNDNNIVIDGLPISASLLDAGLYIFHNGATLAAQGFGPRFYLPKLEGGIEAQLWADVLKFSEEYNKLPIGCTRATILLETIRGALEMEEMMYAMKDYFAGFNAGRWDYIFSVIKRCRSFLPPLPDRSVVSMTVPFMQSYCERLVAVCHSRGAHAIGGMAAQVPSRTDEAANKASLKMVEDDKLRELGLGFDGTWVAHPDLVAPVRKLFEAHMGANRNHQKEVKSSLSDKLNLDEKALLSFAGIKGEITEAGIHSNVSAALQYIACWITGIGAVALENKMEDAATAEISRAQLWHWIKTNAKVNNGKHFTAEWYIQERHNETQRLLSGPPFKGQEALKAAAAVLDGLVLRSDFAEFLTSEAYDLLLNYESAVSNKKSTPKL